jgi:quercetin dioxygenase-like cupin family protein
MGRMDDSTRVDGTTRARRTTTSGSDTRAARILDRAFAVVDLETEAVALLGEPEWTDGDRNTRTVFTGDGLRIALMGLRRDASIGDDATNDTLAIQVLRGRVRVEGEIEPRDVTAGELLALERPQSWRVRAIDESLILLTSALDEPTR